LLRFGGLHAYNGKNQHAGGLAGASPGSPRAHTFTDVVVPLVHATIAAIVRRGMAAPVCVTGGGTGSFELEVCMRVYTYLHTHTHNHNHMQNKQTNTHLHTHTHTHTHIHTYIHTHTHTHTHTHIHTQTHTYTHTHTRRPHRACTPRCSQAALL
jgi:hypothetical protein